MNPELIKVLKTYLGNVLWYYLYISVLDTVEQKFVLSVVQKIEETEQELYQLGVSETAFTRLLAMMEKISITPMEKMPYSYQHKITKLIFSTPTHSSS